MLLGFSAIITSSIDWFLSSRREHYLYISPKGRLVSERVREMQERAGQRRERVESGAASAGQGLRFFLS